MKTKYYSFNLPAHLKQYMEIKYGTDSKGFVRIAKLTTLGEFISMGLRVIPFPSTKKIDKAKPFVNMKYFDESYGAFLPDNADAQIVKFLDRAFREELVAYVAGCHEADGNDYTKYVWRFLERYGIERDFMIDSETARKIYRDYLKKNLKRHQKFFSKLSVNSATCP